MRRVKQVAIAFDQLINALLAGWADETFSSRCWRCSALVQKPKRRWVVMRWIVDAMFFFDKNHCKTSYVAEQRRNHLPPFMRPSSKGK